MMRYLFCNFILFTDIFIDVLNPSDQKQVFLYLKTYTYLKVVLSQSNHQHKYQTNPIGKLNLTNALNVLQTNKILIIHYLESTNSTNF